MAGLLQVQVAQVQHRVGFLLDVLRGASSAHLPDRPALRHTARDRGPGNPAHDPARSPAARAHAGHRGAGAAQRAGEEGPATVPVRPPTLRIQGPAARGPARQGEAGCAGVEGRHRDQRAEDREDQGRSRLREVSAEAFDRVWRSKAPGRKKTRRSGPRKLPRARPASRKRRPRRRVRDCATPRTSAA